MLRVLITGSTGFIGKHVLQKLIQDEGYEIIALSRKHQRRSQHVSYVRGDLSDRNLLSRLASNVDYVIHLAGCKKDSRAFYSTNVEGTENIIAACSENRVKKLIYLSSVGVIGPTKYSDVTELTPCNPSNDYEKSKYQAELLVRKYSTRWPGNVIIIRPTNVFGEDDPDHHLLNLIHKLKYHRFYYVGNDISDYYLNYLYVREISELMPRLLISILKSDLFIMNTPVPLSKLITAIKDVLQDSTLVKHLPYWPVKFSAVCFDHISKSIISTPPINSLKLSELMNKTQYSNALLASELNWKPAFSLHKALHALISHYQGKGLLK